MFAGSFVGFGAAGISLAVHNVTEVGSSRLVAGAVFMPIGALNWQNFFLGNQLPVTIGNIIGGMLIIGIPILLIFKESEEK